MGPFRIGVSNSLAPPHRTSIIRRSSLTTQRTRLCYTIPLKSLSEALGRTESSLDDVAVGLPYDRKIISARHALFLRDTTLAAERQSPRSYQVGVTTQKAQCVAISQITSSVTYANSVSWRTDAGRLCACYISRNDLVRGTYKLMRGCCGSGPSIFTGGVRSL